MPEQAETRIILAAYKLVSSDTGMISAFPGGFRLLEQATVPNAIGDGIMAIGGFPVAPKDLPSDDSEIFVEVQFCPILIMEETTADSGLIATRLFNQLRILLFSNMKDSSGALMDADGVAAEAVLDFSWVRTIYPTGGAIRVPIFRALFRAHIAPSTGEPA